MSPTLRQYVLATRPWSLIPTMMPILLSNVFANPPLSAVSILVFCFTTVSLLCLQAAANLFNTYYDFIYGVDALITNDNAQQTATEVIDTVDDRTLIEDILKPNEVLQFGIALCAVGTIALLCLTYFSAAGGLTLAMIFLGHLLLAFFYSGGIGFKYIALGDINIILSFGPLTVIYAYIAQTGHYSIYPILYALPLTLIAEAILHSNNTRDLEHDRSAGIYTLPILIGKRHSYYLYCLLMYLPYLIAIYLMIHVSWTCFLPLLTFRTAYHLCTDFKNGNFIKLPNRTAVFNTSFGILYILSIITANVMNQ